MSKLKRNHVRIRQKGAAFANTGEPPVKVHRTSRPIQLRLAKRPNWDEMKPIESSKGWTQPCLITEDYTGVHPISKCLVMSQEKRGEFLVKHFENKKTWVAKGKICTVLSFTQTVTDKEKGIVN